MPLIIQSNPCCNMPAGQADVGGWRWRRCSWLLLLLDVPLTFPSDTGRRFIPSWKSSRPVCDSHQSKFTSFISPTNLFLFKHHFCSGMQLCLEPNAAALIPCYPKTFYFFIFLFFSCKWISGELSLFCVCFFPDAHDHRGFGPIFVYNTDPADFLLSSNFSIMRPLAKSNYNSLDRI
ncbi:hypothetical protein GOODEAATRI_032854 [Goodea atripinnis]|uniref:Uncharacterized protein n=1 Tax=Goodea atripinnis TaxID=208336 RepID=A0ABV0N7I2_9TELE